jgi:catechol 2,3-dioxygenase-like lactoylglutathione lyase family enzyme
MLHHVSVGVADVERAAEFYDAVLGALGFKRTAQYLPYAIAYGPSGSMTFWIQLPHDQKEASVGNGGHVGFSARTKAAVDRFHEAGLANGGTDDGAPGPRADYGPDYYGAFLRDPDGNKIEATVHAESKPAKTKAAKAKPAIRAKTAKKTVKARKSTKAKAAKRKATKR